MARFRSIYGASPLHLLAVIASFLIAAYAFMRIFDSPGPISTLTFFVAAIFAHDMFAFPLYSGLNAIANGSIGNRSSKRMSTRLVQPLNYLRVPAVLSAFAFIVFFPLILGLSSTRYELSSGQSSDIFLGRWLGICAGLFTISAIAYAVKLRRANKLAAAEVEERASRDNADDVKDVKDQDVDTVPVDEDSNSIKTDD